MERVRYNKAQKVGDVYVVDKEMLNAMRSVIQEELAPVHHRLDKLEQSIATLQADMTEVKNNVEYLWQDLSTHDAKIERFESKISSF